MVILAPKIRWQLGEDSHNNPALLYLPMLLFNSDVCSIECPSTFVKSDRILLELGILPHQLMARKGRSINFDQNTQRELRRELESCSLQFILRFRFTKYFAYQSGVNRTLGKWNISFLECQRAIHLSTAIDLLLYAREYAMCRYQGQSLNVFIPSSFCIVPIDSEAHETT